MTAERHSSRPAVVAMWSDAVERVPTGAFTFTLASGITSTALAVAGLRRLSIALLFVALAGFVAVLVVLIGRLIRHPRAAVDDLQHPGAAFGHFAIVAALGVLAVRLSMTDASWSAVPLAAVAIALWIVLTYGVPAVVVLRPHGEPVVDGVDGTWLLWVVGTESVAILVTVVDLGLGAAAPTLGIALWGVGIVVYLMLAALMLFRLLSAPSAPEATAPSCWILLGATAISVLAAAQILILSGDSPARRATESFVSGGAFVLWAFGTWWIPLLVVLGGWRHVVRRRQVRYESGLWSVVFPLGMYATASMRLGDVLGIDLIERCGEVATVIAVVAWFATIALMIVSAAGYLRVLSRGH